MDWVYPSTLPPSQISTFPFFLKPCRKCVGRHAFAKFCGARNDLIFNNCYRMERGCRPSKNKDGFWIQGLNNISEYSVEDFKDCLDGIRLIRIWFLFQPFMSWLQYFYLLAYSLFLQPLSSRLASNFWLDFIVPPSPLSLLFCLGSLFLWELSFSFLL